MADEKDFWVRMRDSLKHAGPALTTNVKAIRGEAQMKSWLCGFSKNMAKHYSCANPKGVPLALPVHGFGVMQEGRNAGLKDQSCSKVSKNDWQSQCHPVVADIMAPSKK
jgi:hypothetical protein